MASLIIKSPRSKIFAGSKGLPNASGREADITNISLCYLTGDRSEYII